MPDRVGVLGGTFNPVHFGHLRIAEEAIEWLQLDCCVFLPAWVPPHKPETKIIPFEHRWRMLELALQGNPHFLISDLEKRLAGKSYTVTSLTHMRKELPPKAELHFIVGLDAFLEIHTWWQYLHLFELANIIVARRPGYAHHIITQHIKLNISAGYRWNAQSSQFYHVHLHPITLIQTTNLDISATRLRRLIRDGKSIRYLVPDDVLKYINRQELYRHTE